MKVRSLVGVAVIAAMAGCDSGGGGGNTSTEEAIEIFDNLNSLNAQEETVVETPIVEEDTRVVLPIISVGDTETPVDEDPVDETPVDEDPPVEEEEPVLDSLYYLPEPIVTKLRYQGPVPSNIIQDQPYRDYTSIKYRSQLIHHGEIVTQDINFLRSPGVALVGDMFTLPIDDRRIWTYSNLAEDLTFTSELDQFTNYGSGNFNYVAMKNDPANSHYMEYGIADAHSQINKLPSTQNDTQITRHTMVQSSWGYYFGESRNSGTNSGAFEEGAQDNHSLCYSSTPGSYYNDTYGDNSIQTDSKLTVTLTVRGETAENVGGVCLDQPNFFSNDECTYYGWAPAPITISQSWTFTDPTVVTLNGQRNFCEEDEGELDIKHFIQLVNKELHNEANANPLNANGADEYMRNYALVLNYVTSVARQGTP